MPPKNKSKSAPVQTTLSKFFAQSSTSSSKRNLAAHRTDEKDDFEVILAKAAKKRLKPKVDEEFGPKNKKVCLQDELVEKVEIENHPALDIASQSSSQELQNTASKLKQFELYEEKDVDIVKHIFQSKNCPMIPFIDGQKEDESNQKLVSEENEDEENLSSQAPSLSAFAAPGKVREGQCKANVFNKTLSNGNLKTKKYTPLEQQVVDIKTQRPDALLCVECGYKYRFFGEDAEIAAKVLKIYCHLDHNFMTASIPTHRLFVHVRRLVAAGYKVGVVKQTETAHLKAASDNKTGPFTRRLTALYTKSTLIGQDLDPLVKVCNEEDGISTDRDTALRRNQHLLCIYEQPSGSTPATHHVGIVCVDPATGDVLYDDFHDSSTCTKLETRISHLRPVEIITSSDVSKQMKNFIMKLTSLSLTDDDKIRVETVPEKHFSDYAATVKEFYEDAKDLSFVHNLPKPTLSCLAALCVYLRDFQLESILKLAQSFSRFSEQSRFMYLSSQCLHNLEVFQNSCDGSEKGSLFWMLDNTRTKFGSRLLRKWLNQPLLNHKEILERQSAVEELVENGCAGIKSLADLMNKLPDLERGLCSIFYQRCSPLEFYNVAHFLVKVHKAVQGLSTAVYSKPLQLLLNEIFDCLDGVGVYIKSINEKAARDNDMPSLFVDGLEDESVSSVYATKENINDILREIQDHRKEVRIALRQPGLNYTTVLQTEFLIEVKNTQLKSVPSDWTQISSTKIVSRFHTPFLVEKYRKLNQLREQLQEDAKEAWQIFLKHFSSNFVTYKKAVTHLATVDCLMSLANVASQGSFCKPQLDSERVHIEIIQGRHPIIEALSNGQDQYVPNDTNLSAGKGPRVMTVSGPNMGGKSSYIRQVALITILAQIGSYVPAESASLGIFDAIHTRMGASDDIFKGRSTFMVELHEASEIMSQATNKSLVILDELGRGTSTHDGVAIAYATLKHFITRSGCLVMFVTHFPMMAEFQAQFPDVVRNYHMSFLVDEDHEEGDTDVLTFLYQLKEGAASRSYGLNVAHLAQIPSDILSVAAKKSQTFEKALTEKKRLMVTFSSIFKARSGEIKNVISESDNS